MKFSGQPHMIFYFREQARKYERMAHTAEHLQRLDLVDRYLDMAIEYEQQAATEMIGVQG